MKKMIQRGVSTLLGVFTLLGFLPNVSGLNADGAETITKSNTSTTQISAVTIQSDPFALMYDSDEVFIEKTEYIIRRTEMENAARANEAQPENPQVLFSWRKIRLN